MTIACFGYVICTSGIVYTMLHNMPVFKFDQDAYGKMYVKEYFYRSQRSQYAGEGYLVSTLAMAISMGFLLLSRIDKVFTEPSQRRFAVFALLCIVFTLI